jgi:hypothetical protein
MEHPEGLLSQAENIVRLLDQHDVPTLVIGGVALAAHHYIRHTEDLDLAVAIDLPTLRRIADDLQALCDRYRLTGLEEILQEAELDDRK